MKKHNPFDKNEVEKVAQASYAVEYFIISIANTRDIEVCELGMGIIALLLKRMNDSNGSAMVKSIIEGMTEAVETMEANNDNAA